MYKYQLYLPSSVPSLYSSYCPTILGISNLEVTTSNFLKFERFPLGFSPAAWEIILANGCYLKIQLLFSSGRSTCAEFSSLTQEYSASTAARGYRQTTCVEAGFFRVSNPPRCPLQLVQIQMITINYGLSILVSQYYSINIILHLFFIILYYKLWSINISISYQYYHSMCVSMGLMQWITAMDSYSVVVCHSS